MEREKFVSVKDISKEFGINETLAQGIINDETQRALRRSVFAWCVLALGLLLAGWLYLQPDSNKLSAVVILCFSMVAWRAVGLYHAESAIRRAALAKREAIDQWGN